MALLLIKPEYDIFRPAEHNGTFRGNQLSFIGATAGIQYFVNHAMDKEVKRKEQQIARFMKEEIQPLDERLQVRGIGLIWGIDFNTIRAGFALEMVHKVFDHHLILEVAGRGDGVLKIMPPLTIEEDTLQEGLIIIRDCIKESL